jgi:hypothetical protein
VCRYIFILSTESYYIAHFGLELVILLPPPPKWWEYRGTTMMPDLILKYSTKISLLIVAGF